MSRNANAVIDIGSALDLLEEAVEREGTDHVYRPIWVTEANYLTCVYADHGAPSCIVGHALTLAGVPVEDLEGMNDDSLRDLYRAGRLPVPLTLGALAVLHEAQESQDRGYSWGEVLRRARRVANRYLDLLPDAAFGAGVAARTDDPAVSVK